MAESEESGDDLAEDRMVQALLLQRGIGKVIAENASIAGASGGCQAEIGTAAAMAAGGVDFLTGGYDPADYAGSSLCPEKICWG